MTLDREIGAGKVYSSSRGKIYRHYGDGLIDALGLPGVFLEHILKLNAER